ncbi:small ribosomal subunit protein mS25 [Lepeophtheirus salmonis]|uniref:Small ribosomal subunit protein mS25 n=1 Tax=Lepeophtheirus salmonis TaxID=72036 RepID=A0A0K2UVS9_LEPSM|nr:probable 28S ribosomal protein S25, mitochondrial [Lepeophtheirus salmonis]XP_040573539.1 probable 28S ribosomal protein S25, mitochondrial [Lepeophtheirus salmonis]
MPFKVGASPIRRTLDYLNAGKLVFKSRVEILTVNYNPPSHNQAADFVYWNLPQIQYKNPEVQILTFQGQTPSPFLTAYIDDGRSVRFDVDGQSNSEILQRLVRILGKSESQLEDERIASQKADNPANFGNSFQRFCICGEPGQLPCPSLVPLPKHWRGKYFHQKFDEEEEY